MATREEQKAERRMQILCAGLELFVTKGYAATKVTDIAKAASMSSGLLFHYFESKEKLYEELVRVGLEGTRMPAQKQCASAFGYFEQFARQLIQMMEEQPMVAKMFVLMAEAQKSSGTPAHIRQMACEVNTIEQFVPFVVQGQKEGTIRQGEPLALSNAFFAAIQGVAEQYAVHPEIPLPKPEWLLAIVKA